MKTFFGSGNSLKGAFFVSRCARISALVILAIVFLPSPVWAQLYKEIQPKLTDRQAKAIQGQVSQAIRDPAGFGANAGAVTDYFTKYYFPKMTHMDSESLAELGDMREDLFRRYVRASPNEESQASLTDLSLRAARALAQGNYHPAVRYNGVLILGNLDQQIAGGRNNPTPPIPLPAATAVMLDLLEQEDFKGLKVHPSVQLGALVGLERHARFGIAPQHAARVTKAALDVIAQENPQEEVTKDVHLWMKTRAANVLAYQHREKPDAKVQAALNALMTDEKFGLENRCFIAGLMEMLDYTKAENVKPEPIVAALGSLSQDVLKAEGDLALEYQREILGGGGFNARNMFGGGRRAGVDDGPKFERRQLLSRLASIYGGADSLAKAVPDAVKSQIQALLDAMKPARSAARDKDTTDLEIAEMVLQAGQDVNQLIKSWSQGAAPAEPVEDEFS